MELTSDLKAATVEAIRLLLSDRSRLAAASGTRSDDGNKTEINHAVYSPCELCKDDPDAGPALADQGDPRDPQQGQAQRIEYDDAWLEMFGVPVLYTPYFSHPDPSVKRASGLLAPQFGYSGKLGVPMRLPYYLGPCRTDKDVDDHAHLLDRGVSRASHGLPPARAGRPFPRSRPAAPSPTRTTNEATLSEGDFRGHIDATGRFDVDENWRWGFDIERATDKTYERLYDFSARAHADQPRLRRDVPRPQLRLLQGLLLPGHARHRRER